MTSVAVAVLVAVLDLRAGKEVPTTKVCDIANDVRPVVGITRGFQTRQPRPSQGSEGRCLIFTPVFKTIGECVYSAAGDEGHVNVPLQLSGYEPDRPAYGVWMKETENTHSDVGLTHLIARKPSLVAREGLFPSYSRAFV